MLGTKNGLLLCEDNSSSSIIRTCAWSYSMNLVITPGPFQAGDTNRQRSNAPYNRYRIILTYHPWSMRHPPCHKAKGKKEKRKTQTETETDKLLALLDARHWCSIDRRKPICEIFDRYSAKCCICSWEVVTDFHRFSIHAFDRRSIKLFSLHMTWIITPKKCIESTREQKSWVFSR